MNSIRKITEDIVYVGDSPVDAETASRAGVRSVIVSYGFSSKEELEGRGIEVGAENVAELGYVLSRYL